jgi:hypothetical protein
VGDFRAEQLLISVKAGSNRLNSIPGTASPRRVCGPSAATIPAMTSDNQTESQPVQQNNDPEPHRTLTDADIEELISFFQLLDEWDREARSKSLSEE